MRKKIYDSPKERQKAYRERKKKAGYRRVVIDVPEYLYMFIKGKPSALVTGFIEDTKQKGLYVEFNKVTFVGNKTSENRYVLLRNDHGHELEVRDPKQVQIIERANKKVKWSRKVRLYPDGTLEILHGLVM